MAHIGFVVAGLTGHVNPTLPVVAELARRGHRISYATTEEHCAQVRREGARPVPYRTTLRMLGHIPTDRWKAADRYTVEDFVYAQQGQLREALAVLPVLSEAFAADPPDVLVYDPMTWLGRVLAARLRVPAVKSVTTLVGGSQFSLGSASGFDPTHPALPGLFARIAAVLARYSPGLETDALFSTADGIPVIAYHPRAFQVEGDRYESHVHFVGPCLSGRRGTPRPRASSARDGRLLVLVCLGTVFNRQPDLFRACVEALAGRRHRVVVALGGGDAAALGPVPVGVEVHDYLPLLEVMPSVDVFVSHAGMGSTMEALGHAVPIAAIPQIPEQRANARRLADLGLGAVVDRTELTGDGLGTSVDALATDATVRSRLGWMCEEIRRAPGAPRAAEVIEGAA